jgi:hypothetical protein
VWGLGKAEIRPIWTKAQFVHNEWIESYDPTIEDSYRKVIDVDVSLPASRYIHGATGSFSLHDGPKADTTNPGPIMYSGNVSMPLLAAHAPFTLPHIHGSPRMTLG